MADGGCSLTEGVYVRSHEVVGHGAVMRCGLSVQMRVKYCVES